MMRQSFLSLAGLLICGIGILAVGTIRMKRGKLLGLVLLYLGGSILLMNVCSFQMVLALAICGVGSSILLGNGQSEESHSLSWIGTDRGYFVLRVILALILGIIAYTVKERLRLWIPVGSHVIFIMVWIMLVVLTGMALDDSLLYRCVYLQCLCLGFTMCYISIENSVLVFGCFTAINLLLAFGCSMLCSDEKRHEASAREMTE